MYPPLTAVGKFDIPPVPYGIEDGHLRTLMKYEQVLGHLF